MGLGSRIKPDRLAEKLRSIRRMLDMTQIELAAALSDKKIVVSMQDVSAFERGKREPSLLIVLRYGRLERINMEFIVDDDLDLPA